MPADINSRQFAPGWPLWLFTLGFLPVLISLGFWQLERAEEKRVLDRQLSAAQAQPAVPLSSLGPSAETDWRAVTLQGYFDPQLIWLLDNRIRGGVAGVEVLQILHLADSAEPVLINRGWLAWPDRSELPQIPTPEQLQFLHAEVLPPVDSGFTLGDNDAAGWPRLISRIELELMAEQAGLADRPQRLRLREPGPASFTLDWPGLPTSASKHTGYAVQWFAMALALIALFVWAGLRPASGGNNKNE
ncbi:SURF1 family protein [Halopseudomonas salegens]|nr:SURF1 family protein [Halopseudomonas salegens]